MAEFFQAFGPLYEGFRRRATEVETLLRSPKTLFVLVSGPGEERIADTLFFARRLIQSGYHLGPIVVNRVHPRFTIENAPSSGDPCRPTGWDLLSWAGRRDARGVADLKRLLTGDQPLVELPLLADEPTSLASLAALAEQLAASCRGAAKTS
jgi:anion-transporting  ArsA/GET3 family ATPase